MSSPTNIRARKIFLDASSVFTSQAALKNLGLVPASPPGSRFDSSERSGRSKKTASDVFQDTRRNTFQVACDLIHLARQYGMKKAQRSPGFDLSQRPSAATELMRQLIEAGEIILRDSDVSVASPQPNCPIQTFISGAEVISAAAGMLADTDTGQWAFDRLTQESAFAKRSDGKPYYADLDELKGAMSALQTSFAEVHDHATGKDLDTVLRDRAETRKTNATKAKCMAQKEAIVAGTLQSHSASNPTQRQGSESSKAKQSDTYTEDLPLHNKLAGADTASRIDTAQGSSGHGFAEGQSASTAIKKRDKVRALFRQASQKFK